MVSVQRRRGVQCPLHIKARASCITNRRYREFKKADERILATITGFQRNEYGRECRIDGEKIGRYPQWLTSLTPDRIESTQRETPAA